MSEPTHSLPADVRLRIDQHLDGVEKALEERGWPRSQRRGVTDDLETQIHEMLAARVGNACLPTPTDVEAVLAQLDSPASYGREAEPPTRASPSPTTSPAPPPTQQATSALPGLLFQMKSRLSRPALVSLALIVFSLLPMTNLDSRTPPAVTLLFLILPVWVALVLALQALGPFNDSQSKLDGINMALICIDIMAAVLMLLEVASLPVLSLLAITTITILGYHRSWFSFSSRRDGGKTDITLSVDHQKMRMDKDQALEKGQEFAHQAGDIVRGKSQKPADAHG